VRGGVTDDAQAKRRERRERRSLRARPGQGLGQAMQLCLVQRVLGQALDRLAQVRAIRRQRPAARLKIFRRGR
jgi:hypothetical protein